MKLDDYWLLKPFRDYAFENNLEFRYLSKNRLNVYFEGREDGYLKVYGYVWSDTLLLDYVEIVDKLDTNILIFDNTNDMQKPFAEVCEKFKGLKRIDNSIYIDIEGMMNES